MSIQIIDKILTKDGFWGDDDKRALDLLRKVKLNKISIKDNIETPQLIKKFKPSRKLLARIDKIIESENQFIPPSTSGVQKETNIDLTENLWGIQEASPQEITPLVRRAYLDIRQQWATDKVVADPELNDLFLRRCWELGARASGFELNRALFNARKAGKLSGLKPSKKFTLPRRELDTFSYACEFVVRYLQEKEFKKYRRRISIDVLLCDPGLREEFDLMAQELVPDKSKLELHWALLQIRKRGRSNTKILTHSNFTDMGNLSTLQTNKLVEQPGLYWLHGESEELFFGQTENLKLHIEQMLDRHGPYVIPDWFYNKRLAPPRIAIYPTPRFNCSSREKMVLEGTEEWHTRLNYLPVKKINAA